MKLSMQNRISIATAAFILGLVAYFYMQPDPGPCRKIRAVCESQGFPRGNSLSERKYFQESCFIPLMRGQTVGNAQVDSETIQACRERLIKLRSRGNDRNGSEKEEARL